MPNIDNLVNELNLVSSDQTSLEECLTYMGEQAAIQSEKTSRRRGTVNSSRQDGELDANDEDLNDTYYEDDNENSSNNNNNEVENEDSSFGFQFVDDQSKSMSSPPAAQTSITNRRRSSRSISGSANLAIKPTRNSTQQNATTRRRQLSINQPSLCVGSVGSSSHLFMIQQQQQLQQQRANNLPINGRKHARTVAGYSNAGGVDVHTSNSSLSVQQVTVTDSKNMFTNLQFLPFSANSQTSSGFQQQSPQHQLNSHNLNQQQQQQNVHHHQQQQQQQQSHAFLSTSLPATHTFDSMMLIYGNTQSSKTPEAPKPTQYSPNTNSNQINHPNLNKLLLNNSIGSVQKLPSLSSGDIKTSKNNIRLKTFCFSNLRTKGQF